MRENDWQHRQEIEHMALQMRRDILTMLNAAGSGHTGGSLSAADIMATLYGWELNIDPTRPDWPQRDRFVLSKGHAAPVLYAALAYKGYFPREELSTLRRLGSRLQGHPDMRKLPGVEASTGSLGQGISWAVGMALAAKTDAGAPCGDAGAWRVYTLLGDGELQEGMVWEACMAAAHFRLDNLVAIVDYNGLQIDGPVREIMNPEPIADKFAAFGWETVGVDGHDVGQLMAAFEQARQVTGKPTAIIAQTVKGKGVSFMENRVEWHGTAPKEDELLRALAELG
ncbi:MAG: transketolase [Syntrophomonadaceae bacterium]|nr:transketolase [Syntrophomonadaceae bacterium]